MEAGKVPLVKTEAPGLVPPTVEGWAPAVAQHCCYNTPRRAASSPTTGPLQGPPLSGHLPTLVLWHLPQLFTSGSCSKAIIMASPCLHCMGWWWSPQHIWGCVWVWPLSSAARGGTGILRSGLAGLTGSQFPQGAPGTRNGRDTPEPPPSCGKG